MAINMTSQAETNWCWAAVAVSVNSFFTPSSTLQQCGVASPVLKKEHMIGSVNCCADPDHCNMAAFLQDALAFIGHLNKTVSGPLDFKTISAELDAGRPVGVRIQWSNGSGHFILIDGARDFTSGAQEVHVEDPYYGPSYILYGDLVNGYQDDGFWSDTFFIQA
jgi:hypothetical protein